MGCPGDHLQRFPCARRINSFPAPPSRPHKAIQNVWRIPMNRVNTLLEPWPRRLGCAGGDVRLHACPLKGDHNRRKTTVQGLDAGDAANRRGGHYRAGARGATSEEAESAGERPTVNRPLVEEGARTTGTVEPQRGQWQQRSQPGNNANPQGQRPGFQSAEARPIDNGDRL